MAIKFRQIMWCRSHSQKSSIKVKFGLKLVIGNLGTTYDVHNWVRKNWKMQCGIWECWIWYCARTSYLNFFVFNLTLLFFFFQILGNGIRLGEIWWSNGPVKHQPYQVVFLSHLSLGQCWCMTNTSPFQCISQFYIYDLCKIQYK